MFMCVLPCRNNGECVCLTVCSYIRMYMGSEECGGVLILLQEEIKFPARLSEVSKSVLGKLLEKDPSKRWVSERERKRGGG